jgi:hypothetical protein
MGQGCPLTHTLGRSRKIIQGKREEKGYLPETGDNRGNSDCWRSQKASEGILEMVERMSEWAERSEVSVGVELRHVGGLE